MKKIAVFVHDTGLDSLIEDLKAFAKPSFPTTMKLETALADAFAVTQEDVHVITGLLKASGHTTSDFDGDTWTGQIIYGGEGSGAEYAIYEYAREGIRADVGTPHRFFFGLGPEQEQTFEDAMDSHFDILRGKK